jgi:hypothetical protein
MSNTSKLANAINSQAFTSLSIIVETIHTEIANIEERIGFQTSEIGSLREKVMKATASGFFDAGILEVYSASMKSGENYRSNLQGQIEVLKRVLATATQKAAAANA